MALGLEVGNSDENSDGPETERSPWEYVIVFAVLAFVSFVFEKVIHRLIKHLKHSSRFHIIELINKVCQELTILGIVSFVAFMVSHNIHVANEEVERFEEEHTQIFLLALAPIMGISSVLFFGGFVRKKYRKEGTKPPRFQKEAEKFKTIMQFKTRKFDYTTHLENSYKHGIVKLADFNLVVWLLYLVVLLIDMIHLNRELVIAKVIFVEIGFALLLILAYIFVYWRFQVKLRWLMEQRESWTASINDYTELEAGEKEPFFKRLMDGFKNIGKKNDDFHIIKRQVKPFIVWMTRLARVLLFWFSILTFSWIIDAIVYEFDWQSFVGTAVYLIFYSFLFLPIFQSLYFAWGYLVKPAPEYDERMSAFFG
mmetsp:Transcript_25048/g.35090  ORF Transcript_25048/g.35090 Transcript_25048/m.35090 type:complete len:368 (+) Transcript_25048:41-1144(+)